MTVVQTHFRGRGDSVELDSAEFDHDLDVGWGQYTDRTFRVRIEAEGTAGTLGGTLVASYNGGTFFNVTGTSGTVTGAPSEWFANGDGTNNRLNGATSAFVGGYAVTDGSAPAVALSDEHTEHEFALRIVGDDVDTGGTVELRVAGCDTYAQTPTLIIAEFRPLDKVRSMIGDTDSDDPLLTDNEVNRYIADWPENLTLAASMAAGAIAAKFARGYDFSSDGQSFNRSQRVNHYTVLADSLRRRAAQFSIR